MITKILLLITARIAYYNTWIFLNIDKKHRYYYKRFCIQCMAIQYCTNIHDDYRLQIQCIIYTNNFHNVLITIKSKKDMLQDLKNERFITIEQNDKER